MLVYLAADLLWATKIKSTADALDLACRPVRDVAMLEARMSEGPISAALLDLESPVVWDLLNRLRDADAQPSGTGIRVLCFGPHVAKEAFDRARAMGANDVLPRGAFDRSLPDLLVKLASTEA